MAKRTYALVKMEGKTKRQRTVSIVAKGGKAYLRERAKEIKRKNPKARLRLAKIPIINWA